ncbi:hypothetical protein [Micromonospora sp. NPDC005161]
MSVDRDCTEVGDDFVRVTRTVNAPTGQVFEYVIDVDLSHIFPRTGHSPAIVRQQRHHRLEHPRPAPDERLGRRLDQRGRTAHGGAAELVLVPDRHLQLAAAARIGRQHQGSSYFSDQDDGTTSIEWTYALNRVDEPARTLIKEDLLPLYTERLKPAMSILKDDLEC